MMFRHGRHTWMDEMSESGYHPASHDTFFNGSVALINILKKVYYALQRTEIHCSVWGWLGLCLRRLFGAVLMQQGGVIGLGLAFYPCRPCCASVVQAICCGVVLVLN